jgi:hypothetical protein
MAVALLEAGLAKLHPSFDPYTTPGGKELEAAQAKARAAKLKVWEKDEPEAAAPEAEEEGAGAANGTAGGRERMEVVVSDVTDANALYVQVRGPLSRAWGWAQPPRVPGAGRWPTGAAWGPPLPRLRPGLIDW